KMLEPLVTPFRGGLRGALGNPAALPALLAFAAIQALAVIYLIRRRW
ncbi:MAG: hypothetical protein HY558_04875, partial [Euryarchaeota archaeon]|nr:hypothetical protein [Euryarchaeota archaeon]